MAGLPLLVVAMRYTQLLQMSFFSKFPWFIICFFFIIYLDLFSSRCCCPDCEALAVSLGAVFAMGPLMANYNSLQMCRTNIIRLPLFCLQTWQTILFARYGNAHMSLYSCSRGSNGPHEMRLLYASHGVDCGCLKNQGFEPSPDSILPFC